MTFSTWPLAEGSRRPIRILDAQSHIFLNDDYDHLEHVIFGLAAVDPNLPPALVRVLDDGTLRLAVRFSREVEAAELVAAGVVEVDAAAGYVAVSPTE